MAQITVDPLASTSFCPNSGVLIDFTAVGVFNPPNVFTAELSDAFGSFASPTSLGTIASTTSGTVNATIPFGTPAGSGYLIRVNSDDPPMIGVTYGTSLTIFPQPSAGLSSSVTICSTMTSIDVYTSLGGTPDPGGTCSVVIGAGVIFGTLYSGASNGDIVRYTVLDANGCFDQAQVVITVVQAPDAGASNSITVCSTDPPFSMFAQLGSSPDAGGGWTNPGGSTHPNLFDPSVDPPGVYTYTVMGSPPCTNASSWLVITVNQAPNAGVDSTMSWCLTDGPFTMHAYAAGSPDVGGTWTYLGSPHSNILTPGVDPSGPYVYTVNGIAPCSNSSATLTVNVNTLCFVTTPTGVLPTY